jgi:hypothetical protein
MESVIANYRRNFGQLAKVAGARFRMVRRNVRHLPAAFSRKLLELVTSERSAGA